MLRRQLFPARRLVSSPPPCRKLRSVSLGRTTRVMKPALRSNAALAPTAPTLARSPRPALMSEITQTLELNETPPITTVCVLSTFRQLLLLEHDRRHNTAM